MTNNKLKILGLGSLELLDGCEPELGKEYLLSLVVERSAKKENEEDPDDIITIYEMKYRRTAEIQEIGSSKKLKIQSGRTQSQKLRFVIEDIARANGEDKEEYYKKIMSKIIDHYQDKLD